MVKKEYVYKVAFNAPPRLAQGDDRTEFYFGSITAIFTLFRKEEIGTSREALWYHGLSSGHDWRGDNCTITAQPVVRSPQGTDAARPPKPGA